MAAAAERVCGTPIEVARDDDRARTLILSDLHVPRTGGRVIDDLEAVLDDACTRAAATRVLLLGDLFDVFVGHKQLRLDRWADVAAALRRATDAGVSATVLHGNRDFLLGREFAAATGCRVVAGGLRFSIGSRQCLALHGDELCLRDLAYQRAKRILRNPALKAIFRRLPLHVAMWIGGQARRKSRAPATAHGHARPPDPHRFEPVSSAIGEVFAHGVDTLVFGHIHRPARGMFGDGAHEYCILPAFDEARVLLESEGGELWFRDVGGRRLADYPPRTFPSSVGS